MDVTDHLANLVAKSLVVADIRGDRPHYRLLDTTRAYALEKLHGSGEYSDAARRHAKYYRGFFANAEAESELMPQAEWLAVYGRHIDNVRASLDWAFSPEGDATDRRSVDGGRGTAMGAIVAACGVSRAYRTGAGKARRNGSGCIAVAHAVVGGARLVADVWRWQGAGGRPCLGS